MQKNNALTEAEQKLVAKLAVGDPALTQKEVETAELAMTKIHKKVMFHKKSWRVEYAGGSMWTIVKASAEKRFAEVSNKTRPVTLTELYRGTEQAIKTAKDEDDGKHKDGKIKSNKRRPAA